MGTEVTLNMLEKMAAANGMSVESYAEKNGYDIAAIKLQEAKLGGEVAGPGDELVFKGKQFNVTINGIQGTVTCKGNELEEGTITVSDNVLAMFPGVQGFTVRDGELYAKHADGKSYPVATLEKTTDIPPVAKPSSTLPPAVKHFADIFGVEKLGPFLDMSIAQNHVKEQIALAHDVLEKVEGQDDPVSKSQAQWIKAQLSELYKTQRLLAEIREEKDPATQTKKAMEYITSSVIDFDEKGQFVQQAASGKVIQKAITLGVAAIIVGMLLASCSDTNVNANLSSEFNMTLTVQKQKDYTDLLNQLIEGQKKGNQHLENIDNNTSAILSQLKNEYSAILTEILSVVTTNNFTQQDVKGLLEKLRDLMVKINNKQAEIQTDSNKNADKIIEIITNILTSNKSAEGMLAELMALVKDIKEIGVNIEAKLKDLLNVDQKILEGVKKIDNNGQESNKLLTAIYAAINKLGDSSKQYFTAILQAIVNNGAKLDDLNKLLAAINNNVVQGNEAQQTQVEALLAALQEINFNVVAGMDKILAEVIKGNVKLDEILVVLKEIKALVNEYGERGTKLGNAILDGISKVNVSINSSFEGLAALIKQIIANQDMTNGKIDKLTELFKKFSGDAVERLDIIIEQMGTDSAKLDALIELLTQLDANMIVGFDTILKAINKGNKGVEALLNIIIANQETMIKDNKDGFAAVIEAIKNISIDPVDLSEIKELLAAIKTGVNDNGKILKDIKESNDVIRTTLAAFVKEAGAHFVNSEKWLEKIYNKIPAGGSGGCKVDFEVLMAKLDEILKAIKDHKVEVTVTGEVTCNCNCPQGGTHEGIIGDLNTLLG